MVSGIFDDASMVATVVRVRDVAASVRWYREKLGPLRQPGAAIGPDGYYCKNNAMEIGMGRSEWIATS